MDSDRWVPLPHLEDGFWLLDELQPACRQRLVCDLHRLLLDCPGPFQLAVKVLTQQLGSRLGRFREAARRGLRGEQCAGVYKQCRQSNVEIIAQVSKSDTWDPLSSILLTVFAGSACQLAGRRPAGRLSVWCWTRTRPHRTV